MADDNFLSRWSRRKQEVRAGKPVEPEPVAEAPAETPPDVAPAVAEPPPLLEPLPKKPPGPTMEDVRSLTFESDFKRFVAPDVAPEVKNAAVKKLFADPRYNVRDMMDIYADDYSQPDPIPESMLRQLASAQFLGLFDEKKDSPEGKKDTEDGAAPRDVADDVPSENVAQSPQAPEAVPHADADLRLQQDDAPAGEEPGLGAEPGTAAAHDPVPPGSGQLPEGDQG
ncbi:DUF3306 domain-containing protein [Ramlibacter sp. PS4R-6]|uniref:DUF3306 domain-containing protein n=1 Tax=Ramlibacter sp. PS4R-6 TaxID=3133438 RepID=UPI0030A6C1B7